VAPCEHSAQPAAEVLVRRARAGGWCWRLEALPLAYAYRSEIGVLWPR